MGVLSREIANNLTIGKGIVREDANPLIINRNMDVWQRGTGTVTTTGGYVGVDRYKISEDTDGSYSTQRHTMSNTEKATTGFDYALQANCTGTDSSIGNTQSAEITQKIEAQNCQVLQYGTANAKSITLAFWVKSSKTGTYCIAINKKDSTAYNIAHEYTISAADTWEKKVIHISPTAGSTSLITSSAGAIANDTGEGLYVVFALAIGSNYHATNNTWTGSSALSTSNQVNWMDSTSNNFYLTGVQLEVGEFSATTMPPFKFETFAENLHRCQRYLHHLEQNGDGSNIRFASGICTSSTATEIAYKCFPELRSTPTLYLPAANKFRIRSASAITCSSISADNRHKNGVNIQASVSSGLSSGDGCNFDANASGAYVQLDAEL